MSRLERKYTWKHILIVLLLFIAVAGINLIPRTQTLSSPCKSNPKLSQSVKKSTSGWPLTYSTKLQPKKICLEFKNGKLSDLPETTSDLNVWALIANEVILLVIVGGVFWLVTWAKAMRKKHE